MGIRNRVTRYLVTLLDILIKDQYQMHIKVQLENILQTINMPHKYSQRPVKKFSEFKKLQLELNPSQARDVGVKPLEPCLPECNHSSSNCKHSDLPKAKINWSPRDREDEENAKYFQANGGQMCDYVKEIFEEGANVHGQKSLASMDRLGNTFVHLAAYHGSP